MNAATFYGDRLKRYGRGPEAVGWPNREKQEIRFRVLCEIAPLAGASVLDVGCGLGDLKRYLDHHAEGIEYHGVDVCGELVEEARRIHPGTDVRQADIVRQTPDLRVDYVLASGLFGLNVGDNAAFRDAMLERMWALCRRGMAVNLVSTFVDFQEEYLAYSDPRELFAFCMERLTRKVVLRHDYLFNDFTLYLYKEG